MTRCMLLVAIALLSACAAGGDPPPSDRGALTPVLRVWAHDPELEIYARLAAERIRAASGVVIRVNVPGTSLVATPIFWTEQHDDEWSGYCVGHWIAIDTRAGDPTTTVLHEMLHRAGADHVAPGEGVMSENLLPDACLTAADLVSLCVDAACSTFAPEC